MAEVERESDSSGECGMRADLVEVFSSIQGEGIFCGVPQIFLRFAGCNLACPYCDTPDSRRIPKEFTIEETPGSNLRTFFPNPVDLERVLEIIDNFAGHAHHSVSLTGGEPLLHADFIRRLLPGIRTRGMKTYLETNGTLPGELEKVLDSVDIVSMDMKLPSLAGGVDYRAVHKDFLVQSLRAGKMVFVKMVFDESVSLEELESHCRLVGEVSYEVPVVLQPVTGRDGVVHVRSRTILEYKNSASRFIREVRVIPQMHRFLACI